MPVCTKKCSATFWDSSKSNWDSRCVGVGNVHHSQGEFWELLFVFLSYGSFPGLSVFLMPMCWSVPLGPKEPLCSSLGLPHSPHSPLGLPHSPHSPHLCGAWSLCFHLACSPSLGDHYLPMPTFQCWTTIVLHILHILLSVFLFVPAWRTFQSLLLLHS